METLKPFILFCLLVLLLNSKIYTQVQFSTHNINYIVDGAISVYSIDVDGDGDKDVLSASRDDDRITWYRNDGNQNFDENTITTNARGAKSVYAIDVDGDGDIDVLSASEEDNKIAWYENDGQNNFYAHTVTTTAVGAWSVYAIDLDNDGDMDVLSASVRGNRISWYENLIITGIYNQNSIDHSQLFQLRQNYPNPFNPSTRIEFNVIRTCQVTLRVYDIHGCLISNIIDQKMSVGNYKVDFDGSNLSAGIYYYRIIMGNYINTKKMILVR